MKTTNKAIYVFCLISVLIFCLSVAGPGMAQVPKKINYQGYLQDSLTGEPVTGTVQMEFTLYDVPTGGSPLWSETQQVEVNEGRYSVHLGAVTPLILTEAKPYYLGISIDGEVLTDDSGMEYREELTSGLYSLFSDMSDYIDLPILPWPDPQMILENTFYGVNAGTNNTTGRENTFIGHEAGLSNTEGSYNTFVGDDAGLNNMEGNSNTFVGRDAGRANKSSSNTFVGRDAGRENTHGSSNTFLGSGTGRSNTKGDYNTFVGYLTGRLNKTGSNNTFFGSHAGQLIETGTQNTFLGFYAGGLNSTGSSNTFIGCSAGKDNKGSGNVFLGYSACKNKDDFSNKLCIHNSESPLPLIYGGFAARFVRIHGDLEHTGSLSHVSDQRLKDVQQAFTSGLETIEHIQPVSYRYKAENPLNLSPDKDYVGVLAQEVRQVLPEAVEEGEDGYLMVNNEPILWTMLNAIKELKAQNEALKTQNEALKAQDEALKAQDEMMKKEIELLKKALGQ